MLLGWAAMSHAARCKPAGSAKHTCTGLSLQLYSPPIAVKGKLTPEKQQPIFSELCPHEPSDSLGSRPSALHQPSQQGQCGWHPEHSWPSCPTGSRDSARGRGCSVAAPGAARETLQQSRLPQTPCLCCSQSCGPQRAASGEAGGQLASEKAAAFGGQGKSADLLPPDPKTGRWPSKRPCTWPTCRPSHPNSLAHTRAETGWLGSGEEDVQKSPPLLHSQGSRLRFWELRFRGCTPIHHAKALRLVLSCRHRANPPLLNRLSLQVSTAACGSEFPSSPRAAMENFPGRAALAAS